MILNYLVFGLLLTSSQGRRIEIQKCDGVMIDGINHMKETLKEIAEGPYQLAIDYDTQTLFFSYTNKDTYSLEVFRSAYYNLKDQEYGIINGISGGFANAVDKSAHKIYLGGHDGVYEFDFNTKTANNLNITDHNIWQMFYSNRSVYYTTYPDQKLYRYKDGDVNVVPELAGKSVLFAAIDSNQNIYFANSNGLYCYRHVEKTEQFIGNYQLNAFTTDINGNIYFSTPTGIYLIDQKRDMIRLIVRIPGLYGFVMDSNGNIIYADQKSIVRLIPNDNITCYNTDEDKHLSR